MNNHYQNLVGYIDTLISEKAYHNGDAPEVNLGDLDDDESNELVRLKIEENGRDLYSVFMDSENIEEKLICLLKHDNRDTRDDLIDAILKNARASYEKNLQALIDERCMSRESESRRSSGQHRWQDRETGEHVWTL